MYIYEQWKNNIEVHVSPSAMILPIRMKQTCNDDVFFLELLLLRTRRNKFLIKLL